MKVLDLFAGLGGWSESFKQRGHEVIRVELNEKLPADIHADVMEVAKNPDAYLGGWRPAVVLASPPCPAFSIASCGRHFNPPPSRLPRTEKGQLSLDLVASTLSLIDQLQPKYWWMENPRGLLRKMPLVKGLRRTTVTYCQYGDDVMKPTDLWGSWPESWRARAMCSNGDTCHEPSPRGSKTGLQGKNGAQLRAVVPFGLSESVARACENPRPRADSLAAFVSTKLGEVAR